MTDRSHAHLRELFDRALAMPAVERVAFLAEECRDQPELEQRLLAMLTTAEDDGFLANPTELSPAEPEQGVLTPMREGPGTQLGPYLLLQPIGEGGFGTVFLAEQREPVERRVALKIIKLGMDTRQVVARFEQERQALALMDHPNISRVLDAGATDTGRPYFVMDLVEGEPIDSYCDTQKLTINQRLEVLAQVCSAVQHAHSKGIIHRDIKPSNVLVATQDGRAVAKVIDFGIAKATNSKLTNRTLLTEHQQVIGTLQYMSPEQAEGSLDIDTRADVYSLGILIYELLTGSTPFDQTTIGDAMFGEVRRMIREVEPPRPSTRLHDSSESLANIAARRSIAPKRLGLLVRGELDWIVMKALEKERERRYESASDLLADVVRYLAGEAVVAAPPSAVYRLRKFVRRNKGPVAAITAVGAALAVGAIGFAWQARLAERQRDLAVFAETKAATRAEELQQVADFQARMLAQVDATDVGAQLMLRLRERHASALHSERVPEPDWPTHLATFTREVARVNATDTATEMLDHAILMPAVQAVREQFALQPNVDASLRQTLAKVYTRLGRYDAAMPLQEFALATRQRVLGASHELTLQSTFEMANLLDMQKQYVQAEPLYRTALQGMREHLGREHAATIRALGGLGGNLRFQGRYDDALPLLEDSLSLSRRVNGDAHRDTLVRANTLGYLLINMGRLADAEPYWRECYEQGKEVLGPDDPDTLVWTNNLGGLLSSLGQMEQAIAYYREAFVGAQRAYGGEHPTTLGFWHNLASSLAGSSRVQEAEATFRDLLAVRRRVFGVDHSDTLMTWRHFGKLLLDLGKLDEAEAELRMLLKASEYRGAEDPDRLRGMENLALVLTRRGATDEAEELYRQALDQSVPVWGADSNDRLVLMNSFAQLLGRTGKLAQAEELLRQVLAVRRRISGIDHPETMVVQSSLGYMLNAQGKLEEAETLFRDATQKFQQVLGDHNARTLISFVNLGKLLSQKKDYIECESLARKAVTGMQVVLGKDHSRTGSAQCLLGIALQNLGRFVEAERALLDGQRIHAVAPGMSKQRQRDAIELLLELYEAWEQHEPGQGHGGKADPWRKQLDK